MLIRTRAGLGLGSGLGYGAASAVILCLGQRVVEQLQLVEHAAPVVNHRPEVVVGTDQHVMGVERDGGLGEVSSHAH